MNKKEIEIIKYIINAHVSTKYYPDGSSSNYIDDDIKLIIQDIEKLLFDSEVDSND